MIVVHFITNLKNNMIIDCRIGKDTKIIEPVNIYGCIIGDNCLIAAFVEIQKGAEVGDYTRVQSHSFICSKVIIGKHCFIGHGVVFTNDTFKELNKPDYEGYNQKSTLIEDNVTIGSNVTLLPVHIVSGCVIGAGAVVTKNCLIKGVYAGNPARLLRKL